MNNLVYTVYGINKFDKLKTNIPLIDENGNSKIINNVLSNNLKNANVYRIKINNSIDNIILEYNTKILSIQNIPYELKTFEIPNYLEFNSRYSKITFNNIKDITDFDYICYPIIKFKEDNDEHNNDYYRFLGLNLMNNFNDNINLMNEENKNTIAFINKYLFNNTITYEINEINDYNTQIKFNCPFISFDYNNNNINESNSKAFLKGLIELYYNKTNDYSYINIKLNMKSRNVIYIIKFLLIKFKILISSNYIDGYYIIKIPKVGVIAEIFGINKNYEDSLNYFIYDQYICTKIKSISKISKFNGYICKLESNNKYVSEAGILFYHEKE